MSLEEQIELFTQNLVTKNNLPSWFHRTIKDLISKNVTIEEWNTFTQYISNNASDIKSIEEFVLVLADYIEGYCSKDYVDNKVYGNSISLSGANGTLTDEQLSILTNYKDPVIYYTDSFGVVFALQLKQKYQNEYTFILDVSTMVTNYVDVIKYSIVIFTNSKNWFFETTHKYVSTKTYVDEKFETKDDAFSGDYADLDNKPHLYQHNIYIEETDTQAATFSFINNNPDEMDYDEIRAWLYDNGFRGGSNYLQASGRSDVDSFSFIDSASQTQCCETIIIAVRATNEESNEILFKYAVLLEGSNIFGEVTISEDTLEDTVVTLL